ncbi:hypothetical protein [Aeromonas veronii]|uniref:hypothetical protein n=1 Tax=Aeromonas veronii TaxID=654 RepID=UPI003D1AA968
MLCPRSLWVGASLLLLSTSASAEDIILDVTLTNIFHGGLVTATWNAEQNTEVVGRTAFDYRNEYGSGHGPMNFRMRYLNDGYINFHHPVSGLCMYAENNGKTVMGNCNHDRAKWQLIPNENGSVLIRNLGRDGCLAVNDHNVSEFSLDYPGCPQEGAEAHAKLSWVITPWRGNSRVATTVR